MILLSYRQPGNFKKAVNLKKTPEATELHTSDDLIIKKKCLDLPVAVGTSWCLLLEYFS